MIRKWVEALEQAAAHGYSIDTENYVVMNTPPTLPLVIEPPPPYATQVAACMINETYQPWLNEVGRQFIAQQEQRAELQSQVAEAHERRTPLQVAFREVIRSPGTTPLVKISRDCHILTQLLNPAPFRWRDHQDRTLHNPHLRSLSQQYPLPYHDRPLYLPPR